MNCVNPKALCRMSAGRGSPRSGVVKQPVDGSETSAGGFDSLTRTTLGRGGREGNFSVVRASWNRVGSAGVFPGYSWICRPAPLSMSDLWPWGPLGQTSRIPEGTLRSSSKTLPPVQRIPSCPPCIVRKTHCTCNTCDARPATLRSNPCGNSTTGSGAGVARPPQPLRQPRHKHAYPNDPTSLPSRQFSAMGVRIIGAGGMQDNSGPTRKNRPFRPGRVLASRVPAKKSGIDRYPSSARVVSM